MKYFLLFLLSASFAHAELIPAARLVDWTPGTRTGVIGGIPSRTIIADDANTNGITDSLESIDATGATDVKAAIQAAIDEASTGEIVRIPAGTFRIDSTLNFGSGFAGKTFRGAGAATIFDAHCNQPITAGTPTGYFKPATPGLLVTAGLTKGSTVITLNGDHSYLTPGYMIAIQVQVDSSIPVVSVNGYDVFTTEAAQSQVVRVVSKSGNDITFTPPLFDAYGGGPLEVRVATQSANVSGIGLEDFTVDCESYTGGSGGSQAGLTMSQCYNSWITGVKVVNPLNYAIILADSLNCEIRKCYGGELKGSGSNGAALLFAAWSCLVEDNIFVEAFPNVEINGGAAGNAFLYNYGDALCDTNHAPHNQFNLPEGNAWAYMMSDGYFGSESDLTVYRSYLHHPLYGNVHMRRFSRRFSVAGCLMTNAALADDGYPNLGNTDFTGTAQLSAADPWRDYGMQGTLTSKSSDSVGVITLSSGVMDGTPMGTQVIRLVWGAAKDQQRGALVTAVTGSAATIANWNGGAALPDTGTTIYIGAGAGSFQERDLDVAATAIDKGNHYLDGATTSSLGGDTLANSLCSDTKAISEARGVTWGTLAYPPFDSATPSTASVQRIPAGYRYINDASPPPSSTAVTVSGNATVGGTLSIGN